MLSSSTTGVVVSSLVLLLAASTSGTCACDASVELLITEFMALNDGVVTDGVEPGPQSDKGIGEPVDRAASGRVEFGLTASELLE